MTVLVTGATGHIGVNLVRALCAAKRTVRALVRGKASSLRDLPIEFASGDILDDDSLVRAMNGVEVVYHLAAQVSLDRRREGEMERTNIEGTRNVAAACLECGVKRLVHFSSIHALSAEPVGEVIDETRTLAKGGDALPYDRTKAAGEREIAAAMNRGLDAVTVNPTAVIGPFDYRLSHMGEVILLLLKRRLPALVKGGFNWVDVRDVAAGALAAEARGRKGERYLLGGHYCSVVELAALVEEISKVKRPRFTAPISLALFGAPFAATYCRLIGQRPLFTAASVRTLQRHQQISCRKAETELDYTPRPLRETIGDTIEWFRSAGMIDG